MGKEQGGNVPLTSLLRVITLLLLGEYSFVNAGAIAQNTINEDQGVHNPSVDNPSSTSLQTIPNAIIGIALACGITFLVILLVLFLHRKPFSPWSLDASPAASTTKDLEAMTTTTTNIVSPKLAPLVPPPPLRQSRHRPPDQAETYGERYHWSLRHQTTKSVDMPASRPPHR